MAFLLVGAAVVTAGVGVAKAIGGAKAKKAAAKKEAEAKAEMDAQKEKFAALDTSNPYANMENTMEDLTVNQQEAEFTKQQQQQSQANILQNMKGSAGGSGIAGLAQAMAQQGSLDAQKASVSIGKQEQGNQMAERQESSRLQGLDRQGEQMSRDMERNKINSLMGIASGERGLQAQKGSEANAQMWDGISQAGAGVSSGMTALAKPPGGGDSGGSDELVDFGKLGKMTRDDYYMNHVD